MSFMHEETLEFPREAIMRRKKKRFLAIARRGAPLGTHVRSINSWMRIMIEEKVSGG